MSTFQKSCSAAPHKSLLARRACMAQTLIPAFTEETAVIKVQRAEDLWNSRNPEHVSLAYTENAEWRNRTEFIKGGRRLSHSCGESGQRSWTTNCVRRFGDFAAIVWRYVSSPNGAMRLRIGTALAVLNCGNLKNPDSGALRA